MSDLRLIGSEDGYVLFESLDGSKHRALADDALKNALRKATAQDTSNYVTPREIQERIRNGETVAQICEQTASPEEYVSKFAKPVIDELEHMIESAKAVRLVVPGDRFNDEGHIEFGELIASRLEQANALDIVWSVRRSGATTWEVSVAYTIGNNSGLAQWAFDPRRVLLTPENESASGLSTVEGASGPITKVRVIADTPAAFRKLEATDATREKAAAPEPANEAPIATIESLDDIRRKREAAKSAEAPEAVTEIESADETIVEDDQPEETKDEPQVAPEFEEVFDADLSSEDDLYVHEAVDVELEPSTDSEPFEEIEPEPEAVQEAAAEQSARKPRATMPSWDQIVFGTKSDD